MSDYTYFIDENLSPSRLDILLSELSGISRSKIKQLILSGNVKINDEIAKDPSQKITKSSKFVISGMTQETKDITPKDIPLNIVYEDEHLIVINKQAGLTVHPGAGNFNDTLVNALIYHYGILSNKDNLERTGIVHRLDRDTTGLMVIAKTDEAHSNLAKQIEERSAKRSYTALCWGMFKTMSGTIDVNIGRSNKDRLKQAALQHGGKSAITHFEVINILSGGLFTLVKCSLETGRTHQIRVHMSHIGHSVVGDQTYGTNDRKAKQIQNPDLKEAILGFKRQALHSSSLSFIHPVTGQEMNFEIDLPEDMRNLISSIDALK